MWIDLQCSDFVAEPHKRLTTPLLLARHFCQIALWFTAAELNAYASHSEAWVYENVEEPEAAAPAAEEGGADAQGGSKIAGGMQVGKTIHVPFGPVAGADKEFNEYVGVDAPVFLFFLRVIGVN